MSSARVGFFLWSKGCVLWCVHFWAPFVPAYYPYLLKHGPECHDFVSITHISSGATAPDFDLWAQAQEFCSVWKLMVLRCVISLDQWIYSLSLHLAEQILLIEAQETSISSSHLFILSLNLIFYMSYLLYIMFAMFAYIFLQVSVFLFSFGPTFGKLKFLVSMWWIHFLFFKRSLYCFL